MNFPIVPEYRKDILNINPDNKIQGEPFAMAPGIWTRIVVPVNAPFFVKSLRVYNANMEPLVAANKEGKGDYRIYRIMGGLTELTAKPVACMIEFLNPDITAGFIDYDVVGEFSLFDSTFLKMVIDLTNDNRPAWWEYLTNKPTSFRPKLHRHSLLYDMVAFKDWVDLIESMMALMEMNARTALEVKFDHYINLMTNYINVYKTELLDSLNRHKNAYDSHGFTKTQAGLGLVDNFPTARGDDLITPRSDRHLTPGGMKTILDTYAFNAAELLGSNLLPVAQFGNSNFIPPSIDGSFEGLGGMSETAGICMESDGSLVFLANRFDGRVQGLYYSVVQTPYDKPKLDYTGYRYTHQLFEADGARPNFIAQGSGKEVILVCDSTKNAFYLGLTNGSLDPAKHVYSRLDVSALANTLPAGHSVVGWFNNLSVVLMGDWIYLVLATPYNASKVAEFGTTGINFRYMFRVPKATVASQLPATAVHVTLSFKDGEGMQWMNSPNWRWGTPIPHPNGKSDHYYRWYFDFVQKDNLITTGAYRGQQTLVCPIPDKPGKFLLRFMAAFYSRYIVPGINVNYDTMIDMLYEFDPATNIMTLVNQTPRHNLDYTNLPSRGNNVMTLLVFYDRQQGVTILDDGTIVASRGEYQSFPRGMHMLKSRSWKTPYETMRRVWNTEVDADVSDTRIIETIVSPLKSTVKPRSFLLGNGGDFYNAPDPATLGFNRLYYRVGPGKLAKRTEVTNILYPNMLARPLNNDVRQVNGPPQAGGASVTVPAAQLDSFGTDLGESTFCVGVQKKYMDYAQYPGTWFAGTNPDDVPLITGHVRQIQADGTINIVPTSTILYPQSIVNQLKTEVDDVAGMNVCPRVFVSICDPTGDLTNKFGWLPIMVMINWAKVGTTDRRVTLLSIAPVYSGGANKVVTGYTVLDKKHYVYEGAAAYLTPTTWDAFVAGNHPNSTHGAPRAGYHVNGNQIIGFFDPGISAGGPGDSLVTYSLFQYDNKATRRWNDSATLITMTGQSGGGNHKCVAPDDAVVYALPHSSSTGGAGTMFQGATKTVLLGSAYPQIGWTVFFKSAIKAVFNGKSYNFPPGAIDLRDIDPAPQNKTFYIYALLRNGVPTYEIAADKRLESPFSLWVGTVVTGPLQISTIERFNVFTLNGNRVSELKRGNSIPASSGLANTEGQLPWLRSDELLP
jgi:hypothetical protein